MLFFEEKERKVLEEEKRINIVKIREQEREEKGKELLQAFELFLKDRKLQKNLIWKTSFLISFVLGLVVSVVIYFLNNFLHDEVSLSAVGILIFIAIVLILSIYLPTYLICSIFYNKKIVKLLDEFANLPQYKDKIDDKLLNKLKDTNQLK